MLETEYKCVLTEDDFNLIIEKLKKNYSSGMKRVTQLNYYYDTGNYDLDRDDITLRVRQNGSRLALQVKKSLSNNGLLREKQEYSQMIDKLPTKLRVEQLPWDDVFDSSEEILLKGVLVTERTSFIIESNIKVDIDKSFYLGLVDYELEIEFEGDLKDKAFQVLCELTENNIIKPEGGKRNRFFNALTQLGT